MEQEGEYKQLQIKLKEVQQHLINLNKIEWAEAHKEAKKHVEDHFDTLTKALSKRRNEILDVLDNTLSHNVQSLENININKERIFTTSQQGSFEINVPSISLQMDNKKQQLKCNFNEDLLTHIQNYGSILGPSVNQNTLVDEIPITWRPVSVSTLAGSIEGSTDGVGSQAQFTAVYQLAFNPLDDCVYVSDIHNNMIRKVTLSGEVSKFAPVNTPIGICHYIKENCFFVCSTNTHTIRRVSIKGEVQIFAGTCERGHKDGPSESALFNYPNGIDVDQQTGDLYVADHQSHVIRKISQGHVTTVAGKPGKIGFADGGKKSSILHFPSGVCFSHHHQSLFVCDTLNDRLRQILISDGTTSTFCPITRPLGVAVLPNGSILISTLQHQIFIVSKYGSDNKPAVFAGSGEQSRDDGLPQFCSFNAPNGITVDEKRGNCFVADAANMRIRVIKCS